MKWFWIIVLIVVGVFMAVLGFEYLTVGIGHLPAWVPGNAPHKRGHMYKRGYLAIFLAIVCFAGAGWLIYKNQQADKVAAGSDSAANG